MYLMIDDLRFMLQGGFSDGYKNDLMPLKTFTTHPSHFLWWGGSFKPINIQLTLFVDDKTDIPTPALLRKKVEALTKKALNSSSYGVNTLPVVTLKVGSWFVRKGYLEDMEVTWKPPWDINTGEAMVADVSFAFVSDFLAGQYPRKMKDLPNSTTWKGYGG